MNQANLEDFSWLVSEAAKPWIKRASESDAPLTTLVKQLRDSLSPQQTSLVIELCDLRRRGREKFPQAEKMFFTRRALEQATDCQIAQFKAAKFKAARFPPGSKTADLCCGVGGDLLAMAAGGPCTGVDRDEVMLLLAQQNARLLGLENATVQQADVCELPLGDFAAWHLDPDRRPQGHRTSDPKWSQPSTEQIDQMLALQKNAAIKLAPAAVVPEHWAEQAELQWIGSRGECRQQVAWFGSLAERSGQRSAVILGKENQPPRMIVGRADCYPPIAAEVGHYLYEPHAAVLAAHLKGELAAEHDLAVIDIGCAYLTGDRKLGDPALSAFEVSEVLPFDLKRLKGLLRERGIGRLEVKKRGVEIDPRQLIKKLKVSGENKATLLLAKVNGRVAAILAKRV